MDDYINKRLNELEARLDKRESDLMDQMNFEDSDDEEYPIDISMLNDLAIKFHHRSVGNRSITLARRKIDIPRQ